jgi:hypothetical protein
MAHFGRVFRLPRVNVMHLCTYTVATLMVINLSMPPPHNPPPMLPFMMVTDMIVQHEDNKKNKNKNVKRCVLHEDHDDKDSECC